MNIPIFYFYHYIPASICTLINLDKAYCNVLIFFIPRRIFSKYHIPRGRKGEGRKTEVEKEERQRGRKKAKKKKNKTTEEEEGRKRGGRENRKSL